VTNEGNPTLEYFKNLTIEEYFELDGDTPLAVRVFIDKEKLDYSREKVEKEFEFFLHIYEGEPIEKEGAAFYFLDPNKIEECKQYFAENGMVGSGFSYIVEHEVKFGFTFKSGSMNRTLEEYDEVRKELNANEQ